MTMRKGDIIELHVDRIAFGGQGVARLDGFVVFVKGAVPGDTVKALLTRKKKDFAEAKVLEVVNPSSDRVDAPCPYFGACGGCQWQHARYNRQLEYKRGLVEEAMVRIGGLSGVSVRDPIGSEKVFGYRNKMEFSFSDRPWLPHPPTALSTPSLPLPPRRGRGLLAMGGGLPAGPLAGEVGVKGQSSANFALGLHMPRTFDKIIDMDACLLQQERGNEILREAKRFALQSRHPRPERGGGGAFCG